LSTQSSSANLHLTKGCLVSGWVSCL
ncbi:uncharacterized protein METZ01_LOCUS295044, partial [marine metagenome]